MVEGGQIIGGGQRVHGSAVDDEAVQRDDEDDALGPVDDLGRGHGAAAVHYGFAQVFVAAEQDDVPVGVISVSVAVNKQNIFIIPECLLGKDLGLQRFVGLDAGTLEHAGNGAEHGKVVLDIPARVSGDLPGNFLQVFVALVFDRALEALVILKAQDAHHQKNEKKDGNNDPIGIVFGIPDDAHSASPSELLMTNSGLWKKVWIVAVSKVIHIRVGAGCSRAQPHPAHLRTVRRHLRRPARKRFHT